VIDKTEAAPGAQFSTVLSPGALLTAARERAGWSAQRLAAELCLPADRLAALERDEHASFGGVVFVRGYLRRAARLLGVPPQELIAAFEACCNAERPAEVLPAVAPGHAPRRGAHGWAAPATGVLAVVAAVAGTWWVMGSGAGDKHGPGPAAYPAAAELEFTAPEQPRIVLAEVQPEPEASGKTSGDETPGVETSRVETRGADEAAAEPAPQVFDAEAILVEHPVVEHPVIETPEPAAPLPGTAELRFEFSEDCWLEVMDADERKLAYRLYRAGDVTRLRGKAPLAVFLGNAEGVRLTVDGAPLAVRPASRRDGTARLTVGGGAG
jgi:cytoskeleton protein RodZ